MKIHRWKFFLILHDNYRIIKMIKGPIVIGGIGGSGTRIVASILREFNIFIGDDLNYPLDNLTHTLLFKRPGWYYKNRFDKSQINTGIRIIENSMTKASAYSVSELLFLLSATLSMAKNGHNIDKQGRGKWAFQRLFHILFNRQKDMSKYTGWGWKEPNSHLILENLEEYFFGFKYIHTIRHGLDMAFSSNQQQLYNWGKMFGVEIPQNQDEIPLSSFRYWVEANQKVLELSKSLGHRKVLLLNFDKLCTHPKQEIQKIVSFIGIEVSENQLKKAIQLPTTPKTKDRFKSHDISGFNGSDLEFLKTLDYDL